MQTSTVAALTAKGRRRLWPLALLAYGRKVMEWFNQKTSIAGVQISNWMIVLGAIIVILIIYTSIGVFETMPPSQ